MRCGRLIDRTQTQYQDRQRNESGLLMEPTRKRPRKSRAKSGAGDTGNYLDGQLLIAMPVMEDERFARSVIYVCAHSSEGAMGIIVNRPAGSIDFPNCWFNWTSLKSPTASSSRKAPKA
jgi:hypothetical protein